MFLLTFYNIPRVFVYVPQHSRLRCWYLPVDPSWFVSVGCYTSHNTLDRVKLGHLEALLGDGVKWVHIEALLGEDTHFSNYTVVHPIIGRLTGKPEIYSQRPLSVAISVADPYGPKIS